jgi:hypothetical protein
VYPLSLFVPEGDPVRIPAAPFTTATATATDTDAKADGQA